MELITTSYHQNQQDAIPRHILDEPIHRDHCQKLRLRKAISFTWAKPQISVLKVSLGYVLNRGRHTPTDFCCHRDKSRGRHRYVYVWRNTGTLKNRQRSWWEAKTDKASEKDRQAADRAAKKISKWQQPARRSGYITLEVPNT